MATISSAAGIFVFAFLLGLSGAMMPGPMTFATIDRATRYGVRTGPLVTLGHGIPEVLITVGLIFGLGRVLAMHSVAGTIGVLGAVVLIWMGCGMIKDARSGRLSLDPKGGGISSVGPFAAGILTTLTNPYWFVWWGTVGAFYVLQTWKQGLFILASFFIGHIMADLFWMTLMAFAGVTGRRFLSDKFYRGLVITLGFFLIGMAGYFLYSGIRFLV